MVAAGGCTLRQVERSELGKYGPEIFEAARRQRAGNIDREPFWWERTLGLRGLAPTKVRGRIPTLVLHTGAEGPDGYVGWAGNSTIWTTDQRMSMSSTCVRRRRRHTETCGRT